MLDCPHPASVEATAPTLCHVIRGGTEMLAEHPRITLAVAEELVCRVKGLVSYLADLKNQYGDRNDQLGMVDELLLDLAHRVPRR